MSEFKKTKAAALKYSPSEDLAPIVVASGYGEVAEKIIKIAEGKGIPVFRDDCTASLMCMLQTGKSIPPELYEVIASVYCKLVEMSAQIKDTENLQNYSRNEEGK